MHNGNDSVYQIGFILACIHRFPSHVAHVTLTRTHSIEKIMNDDDDDIERSFIYLRFFFVKQSNLKNFTNEFEKNQKKLLIVFIL